MTKTGKENKKMTLAEDLLTIKEYSESEYAAEIKQYPSYQTTLQKLKDTRPEKSWIQSPFQLPRLSDDQFEAKRQAYIAKYGVKYQIPDLPNIIHIGPRVTISDEDRAAHNWAKARGLPSPLSDTQLHELTNRKQRYLNMISSPDPKWQRNITAVLTALDNAEDALVTIALFSKIAGKFYPPIQKITDLLGMTSLLGSDVINLANTATWLRFVGTRNKRKIEELVDKNPFTKKGWAERATKLKRTWPTFGEILEVAQTTDQMFGLGLCLGSIMGFFQDMISEGATQIAKFGANVAATAAYPSAWETIWGDTIKTTSMLWAGFPDLIKADVLQTQIVAESALNALMPWWFTADPLKNSTNLGQYIIPGPRVKNNITKQILQENDIDPDAKLQWPLIEIDSPTIADFLYTYAPKIKDNYQTYAIENSRTPEGFYAGHAVTQITDNVIAAFSDDFQSCHANTAPASMVKDMAHQQLIFGKGTTDDQINQLIQKGIDLERSTGQNPTVNEIQNWANQLAIDFQYTPTQEPNPSLEELYPGWNAIQDQVGDLYEPD